MKFNLNVPFKEYSGEPAKNEKKEELTVASLVGKVLFGMKNLEKKEMMTAYEIVTKLQTNPKEVELTVDQIYFIEKQMAEVFNVGLYGQLVTILESK